MSYYDDVIKHVETTLGARTTRRFVNYGSWHFCKAGKFSPFLKVSFAFNDGDGTFAYYIGDHVSGEGTGCGCMPIGCQRQESWTLKELDKALENLAFYVREAQTKGTLPVRGGVHLCWTPAQMKKHAY